MRKEEILAAGLLAGTIIGAGMFSLPFIFQSAGLGTGIFYLILIPLVYIFVYLMYSDVVLRTKEQHRLVGYAKIYLGNWAFWLTILMSVVESVFVLTIYLVLSQSFGNLISEFGSGLEKLLIFWFIGSIAIFLTLKRMALLEFLITGGIIAIILAIFFLAIPNFSATMDFSFNLERFLFPLAPILFAFAGSVAIPPIVDYLKRSAVPIKRAVILGTAVPAIVYAFFIVGVVILSQNVSPDAVTGLIDRISPIALIGVGLLGLLAIFSSYVVVGSHIKNVLLYDLRFPAFLRFFIVVLGPLAIYFSGFQNFIVLVSFVGGIFLAFEGILIVAMWLRANKIAEKPPIILKKMGFSAIVLLFLIFSTALIYEIITMINNYV
ncbi:MAG: aromatic amino acid transport family protein [Patescibacteria group bacterium]